MNAVMLMENRHPRFREMILYLTQVNPRGRVWFMSGDQRYQPPFLKPFLGYDQWAGWLILTEWFWLLTLAEIGAMSKSAAELLTEERLYRLLDRITTTRQDNREYGRDGQPGTNHDINALLELMRRYLPLKLHRWLHFGATSYDIINTAYALQLQNTFRMAFWPELVKIDEIWRQRIAENVSLVQAGRTHLQTALPVTVGFWLASLHHRFIRCVRRALGLVYEVTGKFTGAVGTSAAQRSLFSSLNGEAVMMSMLGLPAAEISTQITPPEEMARFYFELVLLSGALANLGEDTRILQASQFGELVSASSTSSTMAHKRANPIAAENLCGMHEIIKAEFGKVTGTLVSDLQRDLRNSSPMRSFSAILVYGGQQVSTAGRLLKSLKVDEKRCRENFTAEARLVMAELLHLALQQQGFSSSHRLVNETIVPAARISGQDLAAEMEFQLTGSKSQRSLVRAWKAVPASIKELLRQPEQYLGDAVQIAKQEAKNALAEILL